MASGHCGRSSGFTSGRMMPFLTGQPSTTSEPSIGQTKEMLWTMISERDRRLSGFNS